MANGVETIRFQVPVPEDVAKAVERLASDMDRPSSWLAIKLLEASLDDHRRFCDWMALTFLGTAYDTIKKLAGRRSRRLAEQAEIRLQLNAPADLVAEITKLAEQWQQSPVKTAGTLLAAGVHNHEFFLDAIVLGKRWRKGRASSGGSHSAGGEIRRAASA